MGPDILTPKFKPVNLKIRKPENEEYAKAFPVGDDGYNIMFGWSKSIGHIDRTGGMA